MKLSPNMSGWPIRRRNRPPARKLNQHPPCRRRIDRADVRARDVDVQGTLRRLYPRRCRLARAVIPRDEELDEMNALVSRQLIERMAQDPDQLRGYLNLIFVSRCLERVGDHATNIAEDAVYAAAAEDIRHQTAATTA